MFFDFGSMFGDTYDVILSVYVGNQIVQQQQMQAPAEILQSQFLGICEQAKRSGQPMQVVMTRYETIWDDFEQKEKQLECYVKFLTWEEKNE